MREIRVGSLAKHAKRAKSKHAKSFPYRERNDPNVCNLVLVEVHPTHAALAGRGAATAAGLSARGRGRRRVRVGREGRVLSCQMVGPAGRAADGIGLRAAADQLLKLVSTIVALVFENRHNIYFSGSRGAVG